MAGLDRATMLALGAMALAVFVIANDLTALSVALPDIESDFDSDVSTVQWVINAYALIFGVLIVTGGRLADMFGRRRLFFIGAAIFALFSVLGGAAQDEVWLIVCRALMGIGGAIMWPAVLGMTYDVLPEDKAGLAGGLIIGVAGLRQRRRAAARRSAHRGAQLALDHVPEPADRGAGLFCHLARDRIQSDTGASASTTPGIASISVGLIALLVALDQATEWGWSDPRILGLFAALRRCCSGPSWSSSGGPGVGADPARRDGQPGLPAACIATL